MYEDDNQDSGTDSSEDNEILNEYQDSSDDDKFDFLKKYYLSYGMDDSFDNICLLKEYFKKDSKILICATSNNPVFDLRYRLQNIGLKIVHVLAHNKEDEYINDKGTFKCQYNNKIKNDEKYIKACQRLQLLKNSSSSSENIQKTKKYIGYLEYKCRQSIIDENQIICCTTRVLPNSIFREVAFDFVIIDEATQSLEPDTIQYLLKGAKHIILVGDINQLGPVIKSQSASKLGFDIPTIERFQDLGVPVTLLSTQYRMRPFISEFSNRTFYNSQIKNGKQGGKTLYFPNPIKTYSFFYNIESIEMRRKSGYSLMNEIEAEAVMNVVGYMKHKNVADDEIGIITFYEGQRKLLTQSIAKMGLKIEVMSVDASQGREKEFIILSCVRSNEAQVIGFLEEYRRLNVAMTRARSGLVVCGNVRTLIASPLWVNLIWYFKENGAIFSGDFWTMRKEKVQFQRPPPFIVERKNKYFEVEQNLY